ncbi:MAG: TIGR04255 family protein [Jatrophihabitans sp.]
MTASRDLADFRRPPVIEVVLGIEFQPIPNLGAAQLTRLADSWADRYPHLEELPALPPSPVPGARGGFAGALVSVGAPALRLWRLSPNRDQLLQVQRDRLVLNWQRRDSAYPHYAQLRPAFEAALRDTNDFLARSGLGSIRGSAAEVVYVNRLEHEAGTPAAALRRALAGGWPASDSLGDPDAIQLNQSWDRRVGDRPATLSMTADSAQLGGAVLSWTYREALASSSSALEDAISALDRGHEAIVTSFADTTTDEMHTQWERMR